MDIGNPPINERVKVASFRFACDDPMPPLQGPSIAAQFSDAIGLELRFETIFSD